MSAVRALPSVQELCEVFEPPFRAFTPIVKIIHEYAEPIIFGNVMPSKSAPLLWVYTGATLTSGKKERELHVGVWISELRCDTDLSPQKLPETVPLCAFIAVDGKFKEHDDRLRLIFNGMHVELQCVFDAKQVAFSRLVAPKTFSEAIQQRIENTIEGRTLYTKYLYPFQCATREDIQTHFERAKNEKRTWIPLLIESRAS
jgi:hypothetical protein